MTATSPGPGPGPGPAAVFAPGPAGTPAPAPAPAPVPVRKIVVLYDAQCPLCAHIRTWLMGQHWLVPLSLIPAGSQAARARFPRLDHASTLREITVVGDGGQVWTGTDAFIVVLWSLAQHRPKANWLATPAGRPFARATMLAAAAWREATGPAGSGPDPALKAACDDQCPAPR
ncbi:DCC1-like thiol-disulfide oxidoreductase family protein [Streptomyces sp. G-G2]|uniref:thiol-disulfide oxidoreductase DCC family protein n=1 Tax=Streptomyces sp. G-G2 TaxID=3046201 RepID=UPI0024B942CD|nr:DCC1-like thiol-disulfide oxidoreductase family protein [Streptomyces sp. G-G2]MDJ0382846.1 DCC1-like thiol-disulfide oxidoreductase family protein [Streptomyces sp. G-G2]